jgi:hypothetical protein
MVTEEDPVCVDTDNIDMPSACSLKETVPEVRLFLDFFKSTTTTTTIFCVLSAVFVTLECSGAYTMASNIIIFYLLFYSGSLMEPK